jgi:hypothetical protein
MIAAVGRVVACTHACEALWISRDGGATWHRAASRSWTPSRLVIAVTVQGREVLYGEGRNYVSRSEDDGESWQRVGRGGMPAMLPEADGEALAVASEGTTIDYVLRHGTATNVAGSSLKTGADGQFFPTPAYPGGDHFSPVLLLVSQRGSGKAEVYRCAKTLACTERTMLDQPDLPWAVATGTMLYPSVDYADQGVVFAVTPFGVHKSRDGGATFSRLNVVPSAQPAQVQTPSMALAPGYRESGPNRTAYVAVTPYFDPLHPPSTSLTGGIYMTSDGGASWSPLTTASPFTKGVRAIAVAPDGRLFASYQNAKGGGLLCSTDGRSWAESCPAIQAAQPNVAAPSARPGGQQPAGRSEYTPTGATQADAPRSSKWPWVLAGALMVVAVGSVIGGVMRRRRRSPA